ncbi:MAG: fimbria/pilus outer membrane usher protein [Myxococcaceae bacterium]
MLFGQVEPTAAPLYLEVDLNSEETGKVIPFIIEPKSSPMAMRKDLLEAGLVLPTKGSPDEWIDLDSLPGVDYEYDATQQNINIIVPDNYRHVKVFSNKLGGPVETDPSLTGVYIDYVLGGGTVLDVSKGAFSGNSASLNLDANLFSPFGTLTQGVAISNTNFDNTSLARLNTTWMYSTSEHQLTASAGDFVSGSLNWTQSIRLGGLQLRRNFATRPSQVLMSLPSLAGSAAVPSVAELFVNNKLYNTQPVGSGPFILNNLPMLSGPSEVKMLVKDANGNIQEISGSFFPNSQILKKGLVDFSLDAGFARRNFGGFSFDYDPRIVGSGNLRYGLIEHLTLESHIEGGAGLINGGLASTTNIVPYNILGLSFSNSYYEQLYGLQVTGNWRFLMHGWGLYASSSRRFFDYRNLGFATALASVTQSSLLNSLNGLAQDQVGLSFPSFKNLNVSLQALHTISSNQQEIWTVSSNLNYKIWRSIQLRGNAYMQFGDTRQLGVYLSLNIPLGQAYSGSVGGGLSSQQLSGQAQLTKGNGGNTGDLGWQLYHNESSANRLTGAWGVYNSPIGILQGRTGLTYPALNTNLNLNGSVVLVSEGLFMAPPVRNSFAVVKTGGKGIMVSRNGRLVGTTGKSGKLLVPGLMPFRHNQITLNLDNLPLMAEMPETEADATPKDKTGVLVSMGQLKMVAGAIVILTDPSGKFLPVGNSVTIGQNTAELFTVGEGGQAYLTGLEEHNRISSFFGKTACKAEFDFKPDPNTQQVVGPIVCKPVEPL